MVGYSQLITMPGSSFLLLDSTNRWNSQPFNCRERMSAFLSKPHFAYSRGSFSRRLSSAENVSSLRLHSKKSFSHSFTGLRKTSLLSGFTSFHLKSSGLLQKSPRNGRRSLTVQSAGDIVRFETEWTPLVKACISQGGEFNMSLLLLSDIFTNFSSSNFLYSITLLTTVLGVSGVFYAYPSRQNGGIRQDLSDSEVISEPGQLEGVDGWLNLSKATPFNRFVKARCPSLAASIEGSSREDAEVGFKVDFKPPEFQRLCLNAHGGGTVALDWPVHLDLDKNKELENVLIIVPGSTEGSEEKGIGKFTRVAEQRGYFPVVLNPRGCGRSPVTTPRVFSAADSDDIRVVAHYIAKRRPWATIMGIGWGFGANMLSKYLGEEAYATPLTAAVCIDNPYNLEKVTQSLSASRWNDLDQALTNGLIKILDANKKLFQGEIKGFNVSGGLAATSLCEFETAISMIGHGYDSLQKFYQDGSSEATLGRVQIPLLCIQHVRDYMGHQISLSQMALEKNPYIMLLVSPSSTERLEESFKGPNFPGIASEWSHSIALEWLAAVEVALLKGRHPLLNVVDLTVNPTKEWSPVGSQITATASADKISEPVTASVLDESHAYDIVDGEIIDVTGDISDLSERWKLGSQKGTRDDAVSRYDSAGIVEESGGAITINTKDAIEEHSQEKRKAEIERSSDVVKEQVSSEEVERGQVQVAAESVMNVLDVTMPGTLSAEQKQQVLEAVGRGETLVDALQEAVPEDVRGTMASAVSAAVEAKGISLKTAGFGEQLPAPTLPAGLTEGLNAKLAGMTGSPGDSSPDHSLQSVSEKEGSEDGTKPENVAPSESTLHETSEICAEKNSPGKASSDGSTSNADLSKDKVSQNEHVPHDRSEDHTGRGGTAGTSSDGSNMSEDSKKVSNAVQGEQPTVASSDPSQAAKTNTDGSNSADAVKNDASVPQIELASNERSDDVTRQTRRTKTDLDDQRVQDIGKSEGKADEKGSSIGSTSGQVPADARASDAAADSRTDGDQGSNDHVDVVRGDSPKASGEAGDKKNEQEPGASDRDMSENKDQSNKQEATPHSQIENNGQSLDASESKAEALPPPNEDTHQKSQNDIPVSENSVPLPVPQQSPAHDQVPPVPSVGQALQALTGFDDATQMAVTNVFGVVESILDQVEKDSLPVETSSIAAENNDQEGANKRASTSVNAHETGDSHSEDDPRTEPLDVSDYKSDNEYDKYVDSGARRVTNVKPMKTNGSHAGSHVQSASRKFQDDIRSAIDEDVLRQEDQGCQEKQVGHFEDYDTYQEVGNGSVRLKNGTAAVRLFADKGEQKFFKNSDIRLVDMHSPRNEFVGDDSDYQNHPEDSGSHLDISRNQMQISADSRDIPHSAAYTDDGNEQRLAAMAAEIDQEHQDIAKKMSEEDRKITNSGGEDQNVVRDAVMNALKLEVVRRLGGAGLDALGLDLEQELSKVANAVSEAVEQGREGILDFASEKDGGNEGGEEAASSQPDFGGKLGILNGNSILQTLGTVLGSTTTLGRLIPLGVLVGVVLAALGALFLIVTDDQDAEKSTQAISTCSSKSVEIDSASSGIEELVSENPVGRISNTNGRLVNKQGGIENASNKVSREKYNARREDLINFDTENGELQDSNKDEGPNHGNLVSAVTAAMGATAAAASQNVSSTEFHSEEVHASDRSETDGSKGQGVHDSGGGDGLPKHIAQKAISMVSPVVPKKEDGEVDQDRLVAMLAEIGQKGGILTLVGKAALLWGGLRGAMSLADRLLGFLRIRDRPLQQRLLGFVGMAILLWTPVLVPLLPTLLQQWATKSSTGVADAAAGVGLYGAVFILVTIWGKRIRGYDRPLVAYGLELLSQAKLRFVAAGMAIGVSLVTAYYGINWAFGFINFSWGLILVTNPSFPGPAATAILTSWKLLSLIGQSVSMAFIVALVEELVFRAWLQEEIAVDLGHHWAIVLSSLAFAVVHWSPAAVIGLCFLSVALASARSRMDGDLSLSIGIHAGIVSAFTVVNLGELIYYLPSAPAWLTGSYAGNPLAGGLGTAMVAALAIVMYPRKQELPPAEDEDYYYDDDS